ncbi:hypothetical protein [Pontibacter akesuensis]|uniref:Uncharacterized protein n=1 Tax=Pontibacter akesuensis TaxID=388950 RepID=A0A1I7KYF5_9BACT|nr:hypothetical protein [Pontibacter akesuensis]SFV02460.1 hypothetical protein SAMN04487941_0110 [Pontibacter akesuensis]
MELLILSLMLALTAVSYLIYRLYIKPKRRRRSTGVLDKHKRKL